MKKLLIISCNDNYDYETRTKYVSRYFNEKQYDITFLVANFDHRNKKIYKAERKDKIQYIHVLKYKKNVSIKRILSHIVFSIGVKNHLLSNHYDVIYHCAPPNCTIRVLSKLKKKKNFKLITEIGDMWPESIPLNKRLSTIFSFPFLIWKKLRDNYLYNSDLVISECELFKNILKRNTKLESIKTLYFCKKGFYSENENRLEINNKLLFCYLGSINNIIDIDIISSFLEKISLKTKVEFHIIGDGEKKEQLLSSLSHTNVDIIFHGAIFNNYKKMKIINQCHYALNIMKKDVCVGMTMKSLDYFSFGIPIVNNIEGDIKKIVEKNNVGFNISNENLNDVISDIICLDQNEYNSIRANVKETHKKLFSEEEYYKKMDSYLENII